LAARFADFLAWRRDCLRALTALRACFSAFRLERRDLRCALTACSAYLPALRALRRWRRVTGSPAFSTLAAALAAFLALRREVLDFF
jgi:hypothetical protein